MKNGAWILLAGVVAAPAIASDRDEHERALKQFFEGRSVTVRIDMPATGKGVDVKVGQATPIDLGTLGDRMSQAGDASYDDRGLELTFVNDILVRIREVEPEPR